MVGDAFGGVVFAVVFAVRDAFGGGSDRVIVYRQEWAGVATNMTIPEMIRPYEEKDLDELLEAWYSASMVAHSFLDQSFFDKERKRIPEDYLPNSETWVYVLDGRVVGFLSLIGDEVGALFVGAKHQRKGIGQALLDHAKTLRDVLELDVFKNNSIGRSFYKKCGFALVNEHIHEETGFMHLKLRLER